MALQAHTTTSTSIALSFLPCIHIRLTLHSEETRWVTNTVKANTVPDAYKHVILCFIQRKRKDEYKKLMSKDSCPCHTLSHYNSRDYTTRNCCYKWHTTKGSSLYTELKLWSVKCAVSSAYFKFKTVWFHSHFVHLWQDYTRSSIRETNIIGCGPVITGKCTKTQEDQITLHSIFCNIKRMDNLMVSSIAF